MTARADIRSVAAMRGGAVDFIEKPFAENELLDAVERALQRNRSSRDFKARAASFHRRVASLTPRERQAFSHVVEGLMNKRIAANLGIAEKSVKIHRARIMQKTAVRSVVQLARIAERFGVLALN